ncbi:unnamed protein product [Closterium sp. NIES-65]|nr:unnamed protein product [Closterium sp. NIES-65]
MKLLIVAIAAVLLVSAALPTMAACAGESRTVRITDTCSDLILDLYKKRAQLFEQLNGYKCVEPLKVGSTLCLPK